MSYTIYDSFQETDLYAPVLKSTEARLLAAANGAKVVKTDTKQAYLYGDMGDDVVYIRPPDWWPEPIPEGHVFLLLKSIFIQNTPVWHITKKAGNRIPRCRIVLHGARRWDF